LAIEKKVFEISKQYDSEKIRSERLENIEKSGGHALLLFLLPLQALPR
jgi:hypothetical protein